MPGKVNRQPVHWACREVPPPENRDALRYEIGAIRTGAMLESVAKGGEWGRYSIFAVEPVRVFTLAETSDPFDALAEICRPWGEISADCELPFVGGWIGYLSYEAGKFTEPTGGWRQSAATLPLGQWSLFDTVLIHDGRDDRWLAAGIDLPSEMVGGDRAPLEDRLDELVDSIAFLDPAYEAAPFGGAGDIGEKEWNYSREDYLRKVAKALEYIRAGDIFQVNLTRRLRTALEAHPFSLYERLCRSNAATHAAYIPVHGSGRSADGAAAILSSSPELFLDLRHGVVTTRPIKGTRPRTGSPDRDEASARDLACSEKDRAELNMIIDLERNDLGRVCEIGSVRVVSDGELETMPTVFHRTATVVGRLREDADAIDLLRATFPGGSVTGAPKVRAMQIINELEPDLREAYCGAIGYIGIDGSMQLNLPIRTMTMAHGFVDLHVGSGIVADSEPEDEFRELDAKAAGMLRALDAGARAPGSSPISPSAA